MMVSPNAVFGVWCEAPRRAEDRGLGHLASTPMMSEHQFTLGHRALMWNDRAYAIEEGTLVAIDLSDCAACPADLNEDGAVDFFDLQMYLNLFADGDLRADFNGDTLFDFFDVQAFLNAYSQGCP